jgi:two-component system sensor histidine kinase YesM
MAVIDTRRGRRGSRVFAKFALALLALDLVPLTAFSLTMFLAFRDSLSRYTLQNVERLAEYHAGAVDSMLTSFNATTLLIYQYRTGSPNGLADFLGKGEPSPGAREAIDGFLRSILYSEPSIRAATLVERDGRVHQAAREDKAFRLGFDYRDEAWYPSVLAAGKKLSVIPPRVDSAYERSEERIVTFARNYYDLSTILAQVPEESPAVLLIDVDAATFARSLSGLDLGEDGSYSLSDASGLVFAASAPVEASAEAAAARGMPGRGSYRISRTLETRPWRLDIYVAESGIARQAAVVGLYLLVGAAICALGIGSLAIVFSRMFSRPLEGVLRSIKGVETGNFDIVVPVESEDEFGALARAFNAMTAELKGYIGREYVARIGRREAELDALRSRLKPHFLANTLEVIRMAAVDAHDETAAAMILALSSQLRYALEDDEDEVSLGRELEMARDYYLLMSLRKKGQISFDADVPESLLSFKVPKLTLQPLVENAMIHGLGPKLWRGSIRVTASASDDRLELCVFDDGIGMSPSCLDDIRAALKRSVAGEALASGFPGAGFLGLGGIHLRLKLRYGGEAGLDVESAEGLGTVVRAIIPLEQERPTDAY